RRRASGPPCVSPAKPPSAQATAVEKLDPTYTVHIDLSIIIVSYNARVDLLRCVDSLRVTPPTRTHEIVVVDNQSRDGSADAARSIAGVRVIDAGSNLGFARATNLGIRASSGANILLLNSDTVVPPDAVDRLLDVLERYADAAIVGPRLVDGSGRVE